MNSLLSKTKSIAIFGTASDVGKSVVTTALCRILNDKGISLAPFKAQNMSNNSYVTEKGEIARAQAVQAEAARVIPTVEMNPILLKPLNETTSQLIVKGEVVKNYLANEYFSNTSSFSDIALENFHRLQSKYEIILIEGAGSCAEVNLQENDFVNFKMAREANASVILVADIDRGGVFAQVIGTVDLLSEQDRKRVGGIIINRFRGDLKLFEKGRAYIEEKTRIPILGVIPYFYDIDIDSEDSLPKKFHLDPISPPSENSMNIAVIYLPHISNFTDFSPLAKDENITLHYLRKPRFLNSYDLVLLPGSRNVRADLDWLRKNGWDKILQEYLNQRGELGGICGGYQMLGKIIRDPEGIEDCPGETIGLEFLEVETVFRWKKIVRRAKAISTLTGDEIEGYEIHHGMTSCLSSLEPFLFFQDGKNDGVISANKKVWGCYLHGLFDSTSFRKNFLKRFEKYKEKKNLLLQESNIEWREKQYDLLANHFRKSLDLEKFFKELE